LGRKSSQRTGLFVTHDIEQAIFLAVDFHAPVKAL
jgi:ABC-type nitrate/sulfonate/bicarbonate transport system ATPase subunit